MSAACCTGRCKHTNMFTIIYFDDGNVSEGILFKIVHFVQIPRMQS